MLLQVIQIQQEEATHLFQQLRQQAVEQVNKIKVQVMIQDNQVVLEAEALVVLLVQHQRQM
jgi:hypothetical protein